MIGREEMSNKYDDIINLPYPHPSSRRKMSRVDRAAQFSPFAALTGYDAAVEEVARLTDDEIELAEDMKAIIDFKLGIISDRLDTHPTVTITYFVSDEKKTGGKYVTVTDKVKAIDEIEHRIILAEKGSVSVDNIRSLDGSIFDAWE